MNSIAMYIVTQAIRVPFLALALLASQAFAQI